MLRKKCTFSLQSCQSESAFCSEYENTENESWSINTCLSLSQRACSQNSTTIEKKIKLAISAILYNKAQQFEVNNASYTQSFLTYRVTEMLEKNSKIIKPNLYVQIASFRRIILQAFYKRVTAWLLFISGLLISIACNDNLKANVIFKWLEFTSLKEQEESSEGSGN